MKTNYWTLKLCTSTVRRVQKNLENNSETHLTYVETTRTASILLKILKKRFPNSLAIHKIGQRHGQAGPLMNLAFVRDDQNRVITIPIYHHVLEIRRKILTRLLNHFKSIDLFKNKTPLTMLAAYLGMEVAIDITPDVYMAHYARWKNYKTGPEEKVENILVLTDSPWGRDLIDSFKDYADHVLIDKKQKILKLLVKVTLKITRTLFAAAKLKLSKKTAARETKQTPDPAQPGKIMTIYRIGLLEDQRNDISFFHSSPIQPDRMLILLRHPHHLPNEAEIEWIKKSGVHCISTPEKSTSVPGIPDWKPSALFKKELETFYRLYLETARRSLLKQGKNTLWLLDRIFKTGKKKAFWKDFFISNNVRAIINSAPGEENFLLNMSIAETGGTAVTVERSILFDYCTYIHNTPNHISFITGPYSLTQIPEPSFSRFTVQAGGINVNSSHNETEVEGITQLRRSSRIVIAVFDEIPSDWFFGDSVLEMYRAVVDLANTDHRFSLLIKTKKPQVLERLEDLGKEISKLSEQGRCLVAGYRVTVSAAAAASDLVVCVPSTAAFESVLTRTRTIVYNPMRSGSRLFYTRDGLNRRVFEDHHAMNAAIIQFADKKNNGVGDCSDLVPQIDPFYDGRGAQRIGEYLDACIDEFQHGMDRDTVLENVNRKYTGQWGTDKIVTETAYEAE